MKPLPAMLVRALATLAAALLWLAPAPALAQDAPAETASDDDYDYEADTDPGTVAEFRPRLAPYGHWEDDARYGTVWVPNAAVVGADFVPYRSAGRWAVADDGQWLWVSDYDWGYIPFHYGRWVWIPARGWAWVPGREYAPAWVVWRVGEPGYDYVGWAPMPPAYVWVGGVAVGFAYALTVPWWFCPTAYLFDPYWHHHVLWEHHHVAHLHSHTHVYGHHQGHGHAHASGHVASGGTAHSGASAKSGTAFGGDKLRVSGKPRSPSFADARVPKTAIPSTRVAHDSRALALRKPSSKAKRAGGADKLSSGGRGSGSAASRTGGFPRTAVPRGAGDRSGRPSSVMPGRSHPGPGMREAPARDRGPSSWGSRGTGPSWGSRDAAPSRGYAPPSRRGSPSYAPPSHRGSPSPSYAPPSRKSAPSPRYAPPSGRSSPSPRYAPPSRRNSPSPSYAPSRRSPSRSAPAPSHPRGSDSRGSRSHRR